MLVCVHPSFPLGGLPYTLHDYTHIGMVAAGTGLTPMMAVICGMAVDDTHPPGTLLFCNKAEQDIFLRREVESLPAGRLAVHHMLSDGASALAVADEKPWPGLTGRVDSVALRKVMPEPSDHVLMLICGPPTFSQAVAAMLREAGFPHIHVFT